jgi:hypothetical protein
MKNKYPLWQYPIIYAWLFVYLAKYKFRMRMLIRWRRSIGMIPDRKMSIREWHANLTQFGHWGFEQVINGIWYKTPRRHWKLKRFLRSLIHARKKGSE